MAPIPTPLLTEQLIETEVDEATDYLNTVAVSQVLEGIQTTSEVKIGLPTQEILALAESRGVDLIVMCSHGKTSFIHLILGSVTYSVIHRSPIPVFVIREDEVNSLQPRSSPIRPLSALVPLDGSQLAEAVLMPAAYLVAALAAPYTGALHLVQVVKIFSTTAKKDYVDELNEEALQRARAYLAQVEERLRTTVKDIKLSISSSAVLGTDVAGTLINMAEQEKKSDLIAMSTIGHGGLGRLVMGDVPERILNATKLPMLTVRPQKEK
jgi:nucleotide-binding universal stress UspA family protein